MGIQSGPDAFDQSSFSMTYLTIVGATETIWSLRLDLERKTGKEINVSQVGSTEGGEGGGGHFGQNGQKLHENYKIGIFVEGARQTKLSGIGRYHSQSGWSNQDWLK